MNIHLPEFVKRIFHASIESLPEHEQKIARHFVERTHISRNINKEFDSKLKLGQKVADKVARFGGSWTFIIIFISILISWIVLNSIILVKQGESFDPFPYILLNLFLSMIAAIQAPIIMMSQNRQSQKDRLDATHDYEVNLKAEMEILSLHEKIDEIREKKWEELVKLQQDQIQLLQQLLKDKEKKNEQG